MQNARPSRSQVFDASSASGVDAFAPRAIIASAAIADVDNDGANEIVISTDETYASPSPAPGVGGSGRAYVIRANGTIAPGWPVKPTSINPNAVPLVAQGVVTSPVVADVSGNGTKQIALGVFLGDATIYNADGTTAHTLQGTFGGTGAGSDTNETTPEGGLPRSSDHRATSTSRRARSRTSTASGSSTTSPARSGTASSAPPPARGRPSSSIISSRPGTPARARWSPPSRA